MPPHRNDGLCADCERKKASQGSPLCRGCLTWRDSTGCRLSEELDRPQRDLRALGGSCEILDDGDDRSWWEEKYDPVTY